MPLDIDSNLSFSATVPDTDFSSEEFTERVGTGFNEYGVRENHDEEGNLESVDVLFEAMEPGPPEDRNGVRITEDFLDNIASKDYSDQPPHLLDHEKRETFAKIGNVTDVWYSDLREKFTLMVNVPNTGSRTHDEAIARYTFEPPSIRDGSIGLEQDYEAVRNDDGEPELVDGTLQEFSTVNFPGGYDDGGVSMAFAEEAIEAVEVDDEGDSSENSADSFSYTKETVTF